MSAAVISSLVRCDEWDRKYEKKDKTPQEREMWRTIQLHTAIWMFSVKREGVHDKCMYERDVSSQICTCTRRFVHSMSRVERVDDETESSGKSSAGWQHANLNVAFGEGTRGEQSVSTWSGLHPQWAVQRDSWTQVSWKGKHGIKTLLRAPGSTLFTAFRSLIRTLRDGMFQPPALPRSWAF